MSTTQQLVGLAAWRNAPLVVRFDPDIAAALLDTPLHGEIPRDLLRRLPAPALFVDAPWLGEGCGVFVSMDSAHDRAGIRAEDLDEIIFTVVASDGPALLTFLRLDQPTVVASIAASAAEADAAPLTYAAPEAAEDETLRRYGRTLAQLTSELLSLLLYLASDEPDAVPSVVGRAIAPRSTVTTVPVDMQVLEVGARLGAALRSATANQGAVAGDEDGVVSEEGRLVHRPVSHLRRAHWHTYWTGPKSDPALRVAKLRWVHMIQVGTNMPVTVRTVTGA